MAEKSYVLSEKINSIDPHKYPILSKYTDPIIIPTRKILGRQKYIQAILDFLDRPEYSNVILLGDAGAGKTSIVQELARQDKNRSYYEVDLAGMASSTGISGGSGVVEMGHRMNAMMHEIIRYQKYHDKDIVLFMDEFHRIAPHGRETPASQAIKPMLANSGALHMKIIAATTFSEYRICIKPDEALSERLQRITVDPPDDNVVVSILESMRRLYAPNSVTPSNLLRRIVQITNKYLPGQSQPRKSILLFDAMLGAYRHRGVPLDERSLNRCMYVTQGVRSDWRVNVAKLQTYLDSRVLDQRRAVYELCQRLYMSIAGLTDPTRPQGSFLFTGATGVGKTELAKALTHALLGSDHRMIRFDMANYRLNSTLPEFRDELTSEVSAHSNWVILFDEVDKAGPAITRMLLPVLDDGELKDANNRTVSFRNTYIIMTTNAAQGVYAEMDRYTERNEHDHNAHMSMSAWINGFRSLIKRHLIKDSTQFPTEFVNRLDDFIPFRTLDLKTKREIAAMRLKELAMRLYSKYHIRIHLQGDDPSLYYDSKYGISRYEGSPLYHKEHGGNNPKPLQDGVISYLVNERAKAGTNAGGARGVNRKIDQEVTSKVSRLICMDPGIHDIAITVQGRMQSLHKGDLIGTAYIEVSGWRPPQVQSRLSNSRIRNRQIRREVAY